MKMRGMTLIEVVMATLALAVILIPLLYYMTRVYQRYTTAVGKKAIFPIADEIKLAVVRDLNAYFTVSKPVPPCVGSGTAIPLPSIQSLRSGVRLTLLTKADVAAFSSAGTAPGYAEALKFCGGDRAATVRYDSVTFTLPGAAVPWDIFNPPPADFSQYTSFDFCAKLTCVRTSAFSRNPICQFTNDPAVPLLALFHYVIRSTSDGSVFSCERTYDQLVDTWPPDAIGELSYLYLGSGLAQDGKSPEFVADSGVFYSNTGSGR